MHGKPHKSIVYYQKRTRTISLKLSLLAFLQHISFNQPKFVQRFEIQHSMLCNKYLQAKYDAKRSLHLTLEHVTILFY